MAGRAERAVMERLVVMPCSSSSISTIASRMQAAGDHDRTRDRAAIHVRSVEKAAVMAAARVRTVVKATTACLMAVG